MIRKYQNHKPQTTLWHREEEPLNHHETPGRQTRQSNQLSLPHQDDCNTRTDTKQRTTKHRTITDSHNGSNNKQKVNNNRITALKRTFKPYANLTSFNGNIKESLTLTDGCFTGIRYCCCFEVTCFSAVCQHTVFWHE